MTPLYRLPAVADLAIIRRAAADRADLDVAVSLATVHAIEEITQ